MTLPPTRPCIIRHPAVMTALLAKFNVQSRSAFVKYAEYLQFDGSSPYLGFHRMKMGIIDSHCHLDKLSSCKDMTLLDLETIKTDIKIHLPFVIANYVYPINGILLVIACGGPQDQTDIWDPSSHDRQSTLFWQQLTSLVVWRKCWEGFPRL